MTAIWGFEWGDFWGDATPWGTVDDDGAPVPIEPGDLDTITTAQDRLWRQFMLTDSWQRLYSVIGILFGEVELVCSEAHLERYVGTARGVNLDAIGAIVNLPRAGTTDDDDYRLAIIAEATSLVVSGTIPEITDLAIRLAPEGADVRVVDAPPAYFFVVIADLDGPRFELVRTIMADVPPAGVGASLVSYVSSLTGGWGSSYGDDGGSAAWASSYGSDADDSLSPWAHSGEIG
jgi:hypothetical protein